MRRKFSLQYNLSIPLSCGIKTLRSEPCRRHVIWNFPYSWLDSENFTHSHRLIKLFSLVVKILRLFSRYSIKFLYSLHFLVWFSVLLNNYCHKFVQIHIVRMLIEYWMKYFPKHDFPWLNLDLNKYLFHVSSKFKHNKCIWVCQLQLDFVLCSTFACARYYIKRIKIDH